MVLKISSKILPAICASYHFSAKEHISLHLSQCSSYVPGTDNVTMSQ